MSYTLIVTDVTVYFKTLYNTHIGICNTASGITLYIIIYYIMCVLYITT